MNYRERMKEYLKESDEYSSQWGKWGTLNKEQRDLIKRLLREMDSADEVIKKQFFAIERLNNIINDLLNRQNEALKYISNFLSMDNRYKHGNGNDELELVRRILNKHNEELKGSDKE